MNRIDTYARAIRNDFRWDRIKAEAASEGYCLLGSVFSLTPSGKFYAPFACSNVMGCKRCKGTGSVRNRKGNAEAHDALRKEEWNLRQQMVSTYGMWAQGRWPEVEVSRLREMEQCREALAPTRACTWCDGMGSHEAAKDADWHAALERVAKQFGLFVGGPDGADGCDVFVGDADALDRMENAEAAE